MIYLRSLACKPIGFNPTLESKHRIDGDVLTRTLHILYCWSECRVYVHPAADLLGDAVAGNGQRRHPGLPYLCVRFLSMPAGIVQKNRPQRYSLRRLHVPTAMTKTEDCSPGTSNSFYCACFLSSRTLTLSDLLCP